MQDHLFQAMIYEAWPVGRSTSVRENDDPQVNTPMQIRGIFHVHKETIGLMQHTRSLSCVSREWGRFGDHSNVVQT